MQSFLERRLTTPYRWLGLGLVVMYLVFAVAPWFARGKWERMPLFRGLLVPMSIASLALAAWCLWVAVRGKYNRRNQSYLMVLLGVFIFGFGGMAMLEHGWTAADAIVHRRLIFCGVMMFLFLGGAILVTFIEDMHRRTEERLIRLKHRLAELSEKFDRPHKGPANRG